MEKLRTRIVLAQSIGINPDDGVAMDYDDKYGELFGVTYKGFTLITGFNEVPTLENARETIKDMYLVGVSLEFDEETKIIK